MTTPAIAEEFQFVLLNYLYSRKHLCDTQDLSNQSSKKINLMGLIPPDNSN